MVENCRQLHMAAIINQNYVTKPLNMTMFLNWCVRMHVHRTEGFCLSRIHQKLFNAEISFAHNSLIIILL